MNRRSFLRATAGVAATAALLPHDLGAASKRNLHKAIMSPEQAVEYLDAINSEWVGWYFDIGNAGRVGPAERWIQVIGKRIFRIHIKDYRAKPVAPGAKGNARPKLLEGDTNWPAVMKALDNVGYSGWAISEQPGNQAADVETARDLARRMDRIFAL